MELELGLKVTRTREDVSSSVDFRFSKDPFGPLVLSRETDSRFIIILHLKGFKKEGIEIDINEEGNRITIRGRKPVEEMVMVRWMAWRKEVELRTFKKVFRIPDFVDLDKIKARFDDDDATLRITMPKRVMGITGFEIEEERVDFGDVSEVENREETEEGAENEDGDNLEKIQEVDEQQQQEKILEFAQEEETIGPSREAEVMEKQVPDELDRTSTSREMEKKMSDDDGEGLSKVQGIEEPKRGNEERKIQEVVEGERGEEKKETIKTDAKEEVGAKTGERFAPNIVENETKDEVDKIHEVVEEKEDGDNLEKIQEVDEQQEDKMLEFSQEEETIGQQDLAGPSREVREAEVMEQRVAQEKTEPDGFGTRAFEEIEEQVPNELDRTSTSREIEKKMSDDDDGNGLKKVQGIEESKIQEVVEGERGEEKKKNVKMDTKNEDAEEEVDAKMGKRLAPNIVENETEDEVDKIHEVVGEEGEKVENAKVGARSEDISLARLQETKEQHSNGQKKIQELEEEKSPEAETMIENVILKPKQETEDQVDAKIDERFTPNDAETEIKAEEFECGKLEAVEVDKKEEGKEIAKVGTQSEDIEEEQFQGKKRHEKQEKIKELVEEQAPKAEKNIAHDTPEPVQERCEEKHKNQAEDYKEKVNDVGARKVQESSRQQDLDERARRERESKVRELVKSKTNDADNETAETEVKEQEKSQELAEEKTDHSRNGKVMEDEEIAEKRTEFDDDDIKQQDSEARETVDEETEKLKSDNIEPDEVDKMHELVEKKENEEEKAKVRRQSEDSSLIKRLQETEEKQSNKQENNQLEGPKEKSVETGKNINDAGSRKVQEIREQELDEPTKCEKESKRKDAQKEEKGIAERETKEQESHKPKTLREQDKIQELAEEEKKSFSKTGKIKEEEETAEKKKEHTAEMETKAAQCESDNENSEEENEDAKVGTENEETGLIKHQESGEQQFQGEKQTEEVETSTAKDIPKPVQEIEMPEKQLIEKLFQEDAYSQREEYTEKAEDTEEKINDAGSRKVQDVIRQQDKDEPERCEKKETAHTETKEQEKIQELAEEKSNFSRNEVKEEEEIAEKKTEFGDDNNDISKKVGDIEQRDPNAMKGQVERDKTQDLVLEEKVSDCRKEILADNDKSRKAQEIDEQQSHEEGTSIEEFGDAEMGEGFAPNIAKTEIKAEKEKEEEDNAKVRRQSEDSILTKKLQETEEEQFQEQKVRDKQENDQQEEHKEKPVEIGKRINDAGSRKVQEIRQQELDEQAKSEKESKRNDAEKEKKEIAETKTKELEHEKIQELAEEAKTKFSKVGEEEETAEKETESSDDDMLTEVGDTAQQDSDAVKRQEEKDKFQESVPGEKVSDGGKGIITAAETLAEDDKSRRVKEIDEQQLHEEDTSGKQFQKLAEVEDVESEKKTIESDKGIKDSRRAAQEIGRKGITIQELLKQETKDEADRPEKVTQELVNMDKNEEGGKTQGSVEEETKDYKEEDKVSVESKTKTDDIDDVRKVQGVKEQELYEPKEMVLGKTDDHEKEDEKEVAESEVKAEFGGLRRVHGVEEKALQEPKIHKEPDKPWITEEEEPSGQEKERLIESQIITEKDKFTEAQKIKEEGPEKPESDEKPYAIQEVVGVVHDDCKEEEKKDREVMSKEELETEEDSPKKVQEIEKQNHDETKRSIVLDKKQETEEKEKTRAMEEKENVTRRKKAKDSSLRKVRDDKDPELSKPCKLRELVESGTSDCREKVKKQGVDDILRRPELDELERHDEKSNIPQLVEEEKVEDIAELGEKMEDDSLSKFVEDLTHEEEREKREDLVTEEATDTKDKYSGGEGHNDHKEELQKEKVIAKEELRTEKDGLKKVQEIEKQKHDGSAMQETKDQDKTRAMEEEEKIVERKTKGRDVSLGKVREDEDPESSKASKIREKDKIQEPVEMGTSDFRETVKKQNEDEILRSQETEIPDLDESERHGEQSNITQSVEDEQGEGRTSITELEENRKGDSSRKFQKQKSDENWRQEESENLVEEEATDTKDKHIGREGGHEKERYEQISHTNTKVEDDIYKKVGDNEEQEGDKQERDGQILREEASGFEKGEEKLVDESNEKIQETEKEESHGSEMDEKLDIFVEDKTKEKAEEAAGVVAKTEKRNSRKVQMSEEQETEKQKEQTKVLKSRDPKVKEEEKERVCEKEMREREVHELEMNRKPDIVQEFVGDEIGEQGDEKSEEAADVVAQTETESSTKVQMIDELDESEKHKEQTNISETSDSQVKEECEERVAKKDAEEEAPNTIKVREMEVSEEQHVEELKEKTEKTENWKDDDGEGNEAKQGKIFESMQRKRFKTRSDDDILRSTRETRAQETDEKKNQEPEDKTEELERKETSTHEVNLMTEDDNLKKDQDSLQKESSNASERRPVDQEQIQEQNMVEKGELKTKADDGKSRKVEMSKMLDLDEAEENKELEKIRKPTEEKTNAPEKEKEGNEKISEEEMQDKSDSKIQDQETKGPEPYKILKTGEHDKIPEPIVEGTKYHREEEKGMDKREFEDMKRMAEDVSSPNVRETEAPEPDGLEKHRKLSEIQEDRDIKGLLEEKTQEHGDEKGRYKALPRTKSTEDSSQSQDVQEKESDQKQELMVDEEGKEEQKENIEKILQVELKANEDSSRKSETEESESTKVKDQKEITERTPQVETKADDDSSRKSETEEQELTRFNEKKKRVKHQEEKEDVGKPKREAEYDHSCKIQENKEEISDKLERLSEQVIEEQELAVRHKGEEKKKALVKKDIARQAKKPEDQKETKSTDDSSRKIDKEKQESDEEKRNEEHDKNLGLVGEKRNDCRNQDIGKVDKDLADANNARKLNQIEEKESTEMEKHEISDSIQEEEEDNENITKEVEAKSEDHESKRHLELKEPVQQKRDNLKDKVTAEAKTRSKDSESRKMGEIKEKETSKQSRLEEQEKSREEETSKQSRLEQQEKNREAKFEDSSSKKIQELNKEESIKAEKQDKIQEPVDTETSEDDSEELEVEVEDSEEEEELEVEVEDSEEDWEAEVIQEIDSDKDNDKIRLGFRLVGGSALFMSLIVIVIRIIRSKKTIKCYKL